MWLIMFFLYNCSGEYVTDITVTELPRIFLLTMTTPSTAAHTHPAGYAGATPPASACGCRGCLVHQVEDLVPVVSPTSQPLHLRCQHSECHGRPNSLWKPSLPCFCHMNWTVLEFWWLLDMMKNWWSWRIQREWSRSFELPKGNMFKTLLKTTPLVRHLWLPAADALISVASAAVHPMFEGWTQCIVHQSAHPCLSIILAHTVMSSILAHTTLCS